MKSSTPASFAMTAGGDGVVARHHHGADPHLAELLEPLAHSRLHGVLEVDDAQRLRRAAVLGRDHERRATEPGDGVDLVHELDRDGAASLLHPAPDRVGRALADAAALEVEAAHPGLRGEGHQLGTGDVTRGNAVPLLGERQDRASLGRLVGQARQQRGLGELALVDPGSGAQLGGLAGAVGDRAGLVEQQRVHVAGCLDRATAHGEHVAPHEAVHPGDADRGEQPADRRRDEAHQQRDEHHDRLLGVGVDGERLEAHRREQEDDRETGEQDVERDLVGRLLALGSLDERDHPVDERLARSGGDAHDDLVGEHPGAAGDRGPVAAGLADHGSRLAGDRRLVDARDPLHDVAVARDDLAGHDDDLVTDVELRPGHLLERSVGVAGGSPSSRTRVLRSVSAWALPRPFRNRLGEVREQHREPEERGHEPGEDVLLRARRAEVLDEQDRREHAADLDDEHHRVAHHVARVQLDEAVERGSPQDRAVEHRGARADPVGLGLAGRDRRE